ncbi:methyltransferase domain-containing protein [Colletotrichum plurivorum]|uniref:Methyltransferase domain-containing protein n=1 Tax=Colletotrichum plurivorum TaxID=2175906 RepID=A0A8H6KK61_9PEZI|nr:methyltransferase domain-containing protein [Colletotrichum plurivorum]
MDEDEGIGLQYENEVVITADEDLDDPFSDRTSTTALSTKSVTASILDYRQENGRTYHAYKDGKYVIPNDEIESDRLDLQHNLFLLTFDGRLGSAPPNDPGARVGRVLDVGTGTGIWATDFGDEHPEAEVLGFDLSATFPEFMPPNVKFEIDDLEEPWTYSRPFDYIHSRMMNGNSHLTPGGYAEFTEATIIPQSDDGTLPPDSMIVKTATLVVEAGKAVGRKVVEMPQVRDALLRAGFVDVRVSQHKWPINTWPRDHKYKEIGMWAHENVVSGWEGLCMATLTRIYGWGREEVMVAVALCRRELVDRSIHAYFRL